MGSKRRKIPLASDHWPAACEPAISRSRLPEALKSGTLANGSNSNDSLSGSGGFCLAAPHSGAILCQHPCRASEDDGFWKGQFQTPDACKLWLAGRVVTNACVRHHARHTRDDLRATITSLILCAHTSSAGELSFFAFIQPWRREVSFAGFIAGFIVSRVIALRLRVLVVERTRPPASTGRSSWKRRTRKS